MAETWTDSDNWHPDYYPRPLLDNVPTDKPQSYIVRKKYLDGVRVIIDYLGGNTVTFFPDGGIHREQPIGTQQRYKEPPETNKS